MAAARYSELCQATSRYRAEQSREKRRGVATPQRHGTRESGCASAGRREPAYTHTRTGPCMCSELRVYVSVRDCGKILMPSARAVAPNPGLLGRALLLDSAQLLCAPRSPAVCTYCLLLLFALAVLYSYSYYTVYKCIYMLYMYNGACSARISGRFRSIAASA